MRVKHRDQTAGTHTHSQLGVRFSLFNGSPLTKGKRNAQQQRMKCRKGWHIQVQGVPYPRQIRKRQGTTTQRKTSAGAQCSCPLPLFSHQARKTFRALLAVRGPAKNKSPRSTQAMKTQEEIAGLTCCTLFWLQPSDTPVMGPAQH